MSLSAGLQVTHRFVVRDEDMRAFAQFSGDRSRIHTDVAFAKERGYRDVIVYGGIMIWHLSHVLGEHLPGTLGTSIKWTINFRSPLYVGEEAELALDLSTVSAATGFVEGRFQITSSGRLIANGATQSIVPLEELA